MIKENDYVKIKKGAYPSVGSTPVSGLVGQVTGRVNDDLVIRLDAKSLLALPESLEPFLLVGSDNLPMLAFPVNSCTLTKRRDTDDEYQEALAVFWDDDDYSDSYLDELNQMKVVLTQAIPIYQFQKSHFFEKLSLKEKEYHVKIIDVLFEELLNIQANTQEDVPDGDDLTVIFFPKNIEILMTQILGQDVAYPIEFFTYFTGVALLFIDSMEYVQLLKNGKEIKKSLAKYQLKMLSIAKNKKYWSVEKKEEMKLIAQEDIEKSSVTEHFFEFLEEQGTDIESFYSSFNELEE